MSNKFLVDFKYVDGREVALNVLATADTGAEITLIHPRNLEGGWLSRLKPPDKDIKAADGSAIECNGMIKLYITRSGVEGQAVIGEKCYVCPSVDATLISLKCLKRLKLVPQGFPYATVSLATGSMSVTQERVWSEMYKEFESVFDEDDEKPMKGPPLFLKLKDDPSIVPHCETKSRNYPVNIAEKCIEDLKKLQEKKIISPMSEPADWCAGSFFIPEGPDKRRFIVDLSHLSKAIERPVHPFLSATDILKTIDPRMRWFMTLDCKSGYFQLELDKRCRHLTTFLTPIGRFYFNRCCMGLSASSDHFCRLSDQVVAGLKGIYKLVDDLLITGSTFEELMENARAVLLRCREYNMHLNRKKIQIGNSVTFAGFQVFEGGYKPLESKLAAV